MPVVKDDILKNVNVQLYCILTYMAKEQRVVIKPIWRANMSNMSHFVILYQNQFKNSIPVICIIDKFYGWSHLHRLQKGFIRNNQFCEGIPL